MVDDAALGLRAPVRTEIATKDAADAERAKALGKVSTMEADRQRAVQELEAQRKLRDDVSAPADDRVRYLRCGSTFR